MRFAHDRHRNRGEAMTRVLGMLVAAIFAAVALLAWVTVPT
jgi:hypothetical protein